MGRKEGVAEHMVICNNKRRLKRAFIGFSCLGLVFSLALAGCTKDSQETAGKGDLPKVCVVLDTGGRNDGSFNQQIFESGEQRRKAGEINFKVLDSSKESEYESNLERAAREKCVSIIGAGNQLFRPTLTVAARYPNAEFVVIDGDLSPNLPKNVTSLRVRDHEASFLAGVSAGLLSEKGKTAFLGGVPLPVIEAFEAGFRSGVALVSRIRSAPVEVKVAYLSTFSDASRGKLHAQSLYANGYDVIYHAAGNASKGIADAAKECNATKRCWFLGTDKDQSPLAPERTLLSLLKRVDQQINALIDRAINKPSIAQQWKGGVDIGLKEGMIGVHKSYADKLTTPMASAMDRVLDYLIKALQEGKINPPKNITELNTWEPSAELIHELRPLMQPILEEKNKFKV